MQSARDERESLMRMEEEEDRGVGIRLSDFSCDKVTSHSVENEYYGTKW